MAKKLRPGDPGYVGRGHPPEHGKIKKGEVRNKWGCKGKPRDGEPDDFSAKMAKLLQAPVAAKDGQVYSPEELLFKCIMNGMGRSDMRAANMFVALCEKYLQPAAASEGELEESDMAILERYERNILRDAGVDSPQLSDVSMDEQGLEEEADDV